MKKTVLLFITFLFLSLLHFNMSEAVAQSVIFEDDFESYTAGIFPHPPWDLWFGGQSASVVDTVSYSGGKSLRLLGANGWGAHATRSITVLEKMGYEAMVRVENWGLPGKVGAFIAFGKNVGYGTWGWAGVAFAAEGHIIAGSVDLQTYELDTWYKVRVVFNLISSTYSVWIDDVLKAASIVEGSHPNPETEIEALVLGSDHAEQICYFDDVRVFEAPLPPPVGGFWVPISKTELLAPWIGLASMITVAATSLVYVKYRKKHQNAHRHS